MLIHEQFRKCVSFLFVDVFDAEIGANVRQPAATVSYIGMRLNGSSAFYAVTARHVVEHARPYGKLYVRVNNHGGGYEDYPINVDDWVCHPSSDVAIATFSHLPAMDVLFLPFEMLATNEYVAAHSLIEGDKIFFTGLFSQETGLTRTQPIVRFGNISLMPHEPFVSRMSPRLE